MPKERKKNIIVAMYKKQTVEQSRLSHVAVFFLLLAFWILVRLFILQVIDHNYYALFAQSSHEINQKIHPHRGQIYFSDSRTGTEYPAAVNRQYYQMYAVPKDIPPEQIVPMVNAVGEVLGWTDDAQKQNLFNRLAQSKSVYAQVARKVTDEQMEAIKARHLTGINFTPEEMRFYPEGTSGSTVLGFCGFDDDGTIVGRYGLEGYFDKQISGQGGLLSGERGAKGGWINFDSRTIIDAKDGPDIVLTIDRTLEYKACERLRQGLADYGAKSAALVLMNPKTGAILAMCSEPDFDPNNYSKVDNIASFNNTSVFTAYEPGSVFKSFTMAAGLDAGLVKPDTTYTDPCKLVINGHTIGNAEGRCWGVQTMTQVLEKSLNTGAVFVEKKLGGELFNEYIQKFGFGQKTGITLNTEVAGDITSLSRKGEIFGANGSYGQGLTATPLQLATAYAAIANDGKLPKPYVVSEMRYPDGKVVKTIPETVEQVISPRAAKLLDGMLTSVVENHYRAAKIDHYYVAGKTGTAQIADHGVYSDTRTNHTFAGFAPADDPQFVMIVKFEEPNLPWAENTTIPVFKDVMQFALQYYNVPGTK